MRLTLFSKVALMLVGAIILLVIPLLYTVDRTVSGTLSSDMESNLENDALVVESRLSAYKDGINSLLWQAVRRPELGKALAEGDTAAAEQMVRDLKQHSFAELITLTDKTGKVIARGHSNRKDDMVTGQLNVKKALAGDDNADGVKENIITTGIEGGTEAKLALRGGAPVFYQGKRVGVLNVGIRLDTDALVDDLKKSLGSHVTFFKGDERIATTLTDPSGKRLVGTKLTNQEILDAVLGKGQTAMRHNLNLGGEEYSVIYRPLRDADGKINGMLFLGAAESGIDEAAASLMRGILLVAGGMAALLGVAGLLFARVIISKPLARITGVIQDLVDDKAELSFRLDTSKQDELASLSHQVNRLTEKVSTMLFSIEGFKNLVNAIPEPVFAVDGGYKVLLANRLVCDNAGVKGPEALIGRHINEVLRTDVYGGEHCPLRPVMASGRRSVSDVFPLTVGGVVKQFRALADVLRDSEGNPAGFLQVSTDVTEAVAQEEAIRRQMARMEAMNAKVTGIAARVNDSATAIESQTGSVRGAAERQSRVMLETQSAVEQMNSTIMEIARSAAAASAQANSGQSRAAEGEKIMCQAMSAIDDVRKLAVTLQENLSALGVQADGIGKVMNVISDIADQTNLLALNAAIEAARAGDAGRGFAVVADEVRKLAEKTMGATQEVRVVVESIQQGTAKNISEMNKVSSAVQDATRLSQESENALTDILRIVSDSSVQITSIAAAAEEQSASSEQIARSVHEVTELSNESCSQIAASAEAVHDLAVLSGELKAAVKE